MGPGVPTESSLSPQGRAIGFRDGALVHFEASHGTYRLWMLPVGNGVRDHEPPELLSIPGSSGRETWGEVSPDGASALLFHEGGRARAGGEIGGGSRARARRTQRTAGARAPLPILARVRAPRWSPDATRVAFWASHGRRGHRHLRDFARDGRLRSARGRRARVSLRWSPDGDAFIYSRTPETGAPSPEIVRRSLDTGEVTVLARAARALDVSEAGTLVALVERGRETCGRDARARGRRPARVANAASRSGGVRGTTRDARRGGSDLAHADGGLWRLDLETGAVHDFAVVAGGGDVGRNAIWASESPDGRRVALSLVEEWYELYELRGVR